MANKAENIVRIEGILAETDLKYGSFMKNGAPVETIGGTIKVRVDQTINGTPQSLDIPVYMFSTKYTNAGAVNPAYESIERVMKDFVSIAAAGGIAQADKIRITNAEIRMNEFPDMNGKVVSQPRITTSFVSRVTGDFDPSATFNLSFMVSKMSRAVDNQGVELEPARLNVEVIVPQYTKPGAPALNVDVVQLCATNPNVISAVEQFWEAGECFRAAGRLNFSSKTEEIVEEMGFGEAQKKVRTISVNDFVISGGSNEPLGDGGWTYEEIKAGMALRAQKLEELKTKRNERNKVKNTPAPAAPAQKAVDLGF